MNTKDKRNILKALVAKMAEKAMATHSSVLAWRIPGTGEPGGCRPWGPWGRTESDTTEVT